MMQSLSTLENPQKAVRTGEWVSRTGCQCRKAGPCGFLYVLYMDI